jgi:hypothetical protein
MSDPLLSQGDFTVVRRTEVVGTNGRTSTTDETFPNVKGIVTQQDPADLMRREDGQLVPRSIFVATAFPMRNAAVGAQPDRIIWDGTSYLVKQVMPYRRSGLFEVVASSDTAVDTVPS